VRGNGNDRVLIGPMGIPWEWESEYRFARIWEWEYRIREREYNNGNGNQFPKLNGNQLLFAEIACD